MMPDSLYIFSHKVVDYHDVSYEKLLLEAPPAVRKGILKYYYLRNRVLKTAGHQLLKHAILKTGGSVNLLDEIQVNENGKPFIARWCHYNFSYSGDMVVLLFGSIGNIGIDIEFIKEIDVEAMKSICHPKELLYINQQDCTLRAFLEIWVKKEAVLKASGTGLIDNLETVDCSSDTVYYLGHYWQSCRIKEIGEDYISYISAAASRLSYTVAAYNCDQLFIE